MENDDIKTTMIGGCSFRKGAWIPGGRKSEERLVKLSF